MEIKIPYTYTNYPFSKKATKYSKVIGQYKLKTTTIGIWAATSMLLFCAFVMLVTWFSSLWGNRINNDITFIIMLLAPLVGSGYIAVQIKMIILAVYTDKLKKQLELEAQKLDEGDPRKAAAIRAHIAKELQ